MLGRATAAGRRLPLVACAPVRHAGIVLVQLGCTEIRAENGGRETVQRPRKIVWIRAEHLWLPLGARDRAEASVGGKVKHAGVIDEVLGAVNAETAGPVANLNLCDFETNRCKGAAACVDTLWKELPTLENDEREHHG
jgi:hypothetical protein